MQCNHCGSLILSNGQCPGGCTPTERDTEMAKDKSWPVQLNVADVQDLIFKIESLPWHYQPNVAELNALENLRNTIAEYQQYLLKGTD